MVTDHLGSSRYLMDRCGSCIAQHKFLPFGEEATGSSDDGERMRFTGHERDLKNPANATDDLDYMHARYYNPNLARFISVDPVGGKPELPQSWNGYSYVRNSPIGFVDPDGMMWLQARDHRWVTNEGWQFRVTFETGPFSAPHGVKIPGRSLVGRVVGVWRAIQGAFDHFSTQSWGGPPVASKVAGTVLENDELRYAAESEMKSSWEASVKGGELTQDKDGWTPDANIAKLKAAVVAGLVTWSSKSGVVLSDEQLKAILKAYEVEDLFEEAKRKLGDVKLEREH